MIKLILWITWLILLSLMCYILSHKVLLTPQFGLIACFIPQAIYALFYVKVWNLDFSFETMCVLFGGTAFFAFVSTLLQYFYILYRKNHSYAYTVGTEIEKKEIHIERWKLMTLLIVQIIVLLLFIGYLMNLGKGTLLNNIVYYNRVSKFAEIEDKAAIAIPRYISWPYSFCTVSSFLCVYILIHSVILKYKQHRFLLCINILLSVILYALKGGRFPIIALSISIVAMMYFISGRLNKWKKSLRPQTILKIIGGFALVVVTFQAAGGILGRSSSNSFSDYLSVYFSAELKNLDIFIRERNFGCDVSNWQTLISLVNFIGKHVNPEWIHTYDQPFLRVNGRSLGNVYTIFYWYLHDGGHMAVFLFLSLLAITSQYFFQKAAFKRQKELVNMNVIIYSYLFYAIVLSFFCERYFLELFSPKFVKMIVSLWMLKVFFLKVRVKQKFRARNWRTQSLNSGKMG